MRTYLYALPLTLLLAACGATPLCGDSTNCAGTTTGTTAESTTAESTTAESTTAESTTDTTEQPTSTSEPEPVTTTETGEPEPLTTSETDTDEPPLQGEPAIYSDACAPDDGPAVEFKIDLAERACDSDWPEDVPFLRIVLFKDVELAPGEHPLTGGMGFVWYDDGNGQPLTGDVGSVVIDEVTADGVRGSYDVALSDNTPLSGSFDALYCPVVVPCG
jgi:hypothetical protein